MQHIYVGLGSNMGDSISILEQAVSLLGQENPASTYFFTQFPLVVDAVSKIYITEPQGYTDQPFFHNQVVRLLCPDTITPKQVLAHLQWIENTLGRVRTGHKDGPRMIDLDILLYNAVQLSTEKLIIPHPRMCERAFVLVPLAEIAPNLILPCGEALAVALQKIDYLLKGTTIYQNSL